MADLERIADGGASVLIDRVAALIEQTRTSIASQANAALTMMNWQIGHLTDAEVLGEQRAGYAGEIVASLCQQLSWTHFRALIQVYSDEARAFSVKQALDARLSVRALRELIGRQSFERREIANAQTPGASSVPLDALTDPYCVDFFELKAASAERDLEKALIRGWRRSSSKSAMAGASWRGRSG
ncbi:DUF1016 N-terminal domain-containing protein [Rathayibacter sp. Leaf248]|uniref:DUF1016 N-terminal domain-containing protein n=1 Tax=Rathayibacter sp. Leaf248 TaxID=2876555 RepID=UPI001E64AF93|nr:DUF1016 N-terminal domain-containing protein [Rathayibacter sp. Leaf248]